MIDACISPSEATAALARPFIVAGKMGFLAVDLKINRRNEAYACYRDGISGRAHGRFGRICHGGALHIDDIGKEI